MGIDGEYVSYCWYTDNISLTVIRSLQRTLSELRDYQVKHDMWKQQQAKLNSEQAPLSEKIDQRLSYETYKMRLANEGVG